ncbi:MAG: hypothetical protein ACJ74F_32740, partial [Mycobacterium sp.]|uniref:hypothetical protein n=1 Tax=Mycobacterium sp. TaxID=1785 RepID=UPI00389ADDA7
MQEKDLLATAIVVTGAEIAEIAEIANGSSDESRQAYAQRLHQAVTNAIERGDYSHDAVKDEPNSSRARLGSCFMSSSNSPTATLAFPRC